MGGQEAAQRVAKGLGRRRLRRRRLRWWRWRRQDMVAAQFKLLAQTTVAVSPCGGVSMILPFLPQGAYAVLLNYMLGAGEPQRHGECEGCSWTMEAELWRHVRHVHKMYYQVFGDDDFAKGVPGRDAALRVDPQRLGGLVQAALHEMEPY